MKKEFVSDLNFPEIYHAVLVRSEKIGTIDKIILPDLPENVEFFSAQDIKGEKEIKIFNYKIPVFAFYKVEFLGQAVGILVGTEKRELLELAKMFEIKIIQDFSEDDYDTSKNEQPKNYSILSKRNFEFGNCKSIFEKAGVNEPCISSFEFENFYHNRSECACVKVIHSKNNTYDVYLATQWPYCVAETVSKVLDVPKKNIDINSTNFGEHLNSLIWFPALLASQVAVAASLSGKNISLNFSRREDYSFSTCSPRVTIQHKTLVDDLGKFLAMDVKVIIYAGAFNPVIDEMILQIATVASSIYDIKNLYVDIVAYKTPDKPTDFFCGLGENYILNALENHINEIALQKNISPIEIRLLNINSNNNKIGGKIFFTENFDFEKLLKDVCDKSDYNRKYYSNKFLNEKTKNEVKSRVRGIGLATGLQCSGINSFIKRGVSYSVEMTITKDGKAIVKVVDCSEDLKKIFSKRISLKLGIEETNIKIIDADEKEFNIIKTMENNILYLTDLIDKCCSSIERQRFRKPLPITVKRKTQLTKSKNWNPDTLEGFPFVSQTPGACIVELELNPLLYKVKVKNIWLSVAPGNVLQKQAVIQKIKKEIQNCISQLTIEDANVKDFLQFRILNITDSPSANVSVIELNAKDKIYKGVENIANNLIPAAFISALKQIFINDKNSHFSMPSTQDKIYNKIMEIRAKELEEQSNENITEDINTGEIKTETIV